MSLDCDVGPEVVPDDDPPDDVPPERAGRDRARGVEGEHHVRPLVVAPGVGGARLEGDPVRRGRRLPEEHVVDEQHARAAEVELGPVDPDAVVQVERVRPRRKHEAAPAERPDGRAVGEGHRDRVVQVEGDEELAVGGTRATRPEPENERNHHGRQGDKAGCSRDPSGHRADLRCCRLRRGDPTELALRLTSAASADSHPGPTGARTRPGDCRDGSIAGSVGESTKRGGQGKRGSRLRGTNEPKGTHDERRRRARAEGSEVQQARFPPTRVAWERVLSRSAAGSPVFWLDPVRIGAGPSQCVPTDPQHFGRMFHLPPFAPASRACASRCSRSARRAGLLDAQDPLSEGPVQLITNPGSSPNNRDNPKHTAGTTFFGPVPRPRHDLRHDLAAGRPDRPASARRTSRTPALDLDSVYGGGPVASPELYNPSDRAKLRIESAACSRTCRARPTARAIIADPATTRT